MEPGSSEPGDLVISRFSFTGSLCLQWSQVLANPETSKPKTLEEADAQILQWSQVLANPETGRSNGH